MKKMLWIALAAGVLAGPAGLRIQQGISGFDQESNYCVECHKTIPKDSFVGEHYEDWARSIHRENGITCDACHGGNPTKPLQKEAHIGMFNSSNPKSKVYFKNVPRTCGQCHTKEYRTFRKSVHYQELQKRGRGPTCVTCHGARATWIITPDQIKAVCTRCHNERMEIDPEVPIHAYYVLYLMNVTSTMLDRIERWTETSKVRAEGRKHLRLAQEAMTKASANWHTFHIDSVRVQIQKAIEEAQKVR